MNSGLGRDQRGPSPLISGAMGCENWVTGRRSATNRHSGGRSQRIFLAMRASNRLACRKYKPCCAFSPPQTAAANNPHKRERPSLPLVCTHGAWCALAIHWPLWPRRRNLALRHESEDDGSHLLAPEFIGASASDFESATAQTPRQFASARYHPEKLKRAASGSPRDAECCEVLVLIMRKRRVKCEDGA